MKLESTELRICNYVSITQSAHKDDVEAVTSFMLQQIENGYKVFGIPLTEDILLKCGFEKEEDSNCYFNQIALYFTFDKITCNVSYYEYDNLINIDYVHQLQNLYFALTNEELNINL